MIVDGENLIDPASLVDRIHHVDVLARSTSQEVDGHEAVVEADAAGRDRIEAVVLEQRVLHDAHERAAVRRDGKPFHPAVGLSSGDVVVGEELERVAAGVDVTRRPAVDGIEPELLRQEDAPQQAAAAIELADVRAVFVGDEDGAEETDDDGLGVEAPGGERIVGVESVGVADEAAVPLVLEESRRDDAGLDVRKRRLGIDSHLQEMEAIGVGDVGAPVEGTAIRHREKDVVEAGVGHGRAEAAERRLVDARGIVIDAANCLSGKSGPIQAVAGDGADANKGDAGIGRRQRHDRGRSHYGARTYEPFRFHALLHVQDELVGQASIVAPCKQKLTAG